MGWVDDDNLETIQDVARRSISSSPFPDWFPLLDWRERFAPIWESSFCTAKGWWYAEDDDGRPYSEYEDFRPSRGGGTVVCEDGAPAEIEDGGGTCPVSSSDARIRADLVVA